MRLAEELHVGDKFKVAHPGQMSGNGRKMPLNVEFEVVKIYVQDPHWLVLTSPGVDGVFTLPPTAPILRLNELQPFENEVTEFMGVRGRKKAIGFRLLWDGRSPLNRASNQGAAVIRMLKALGLESFTTGQAINACILHLKDFSFENQVNPSLAWAQQMRSLVLLGLIERVLDPGTSSKELREAEIRDT